MNSVRHTEHVFSVLVVLYSILEAIQIQTGIRLGEFR